LYYLGRTVRGTNRPGLTRVQGWIVRGRIVRGRNVRTPISSPLLFEIRRPPGGPLFTAFRQWV